MLPGYQQKGGCWRERAQEATRADASRSVSAAEWERFRVSDLSASTWREIEKQSIVLPAYNLGRLIEVGKLRTIIRQSRRTSPQNALLWSLYEDAIERGGETLGGWTKEDIHEFMLGEFFGWQVCEAFGRKRQKPKKRSSRLTKTQFSEFVEFVVQRFAEHGIVLELPGDLQ